MGYDLHITRKQDWAADDGDAIEPAEWIAAVARIGGFEPVSKVELGDTALNLPEEWLSHRWNGHPEHPGAGPIFRLSHGNVTLGGSDTATLHLAFKIADLLRARIVGDEGDEYVPRSLLGPENDSGWTARNPFTNEPIYRECEGILEKRGLEWHLVTAKRGLLGLRRSDERILLYWLAPLPAGAPGCTVRLRGTLSEPGDYGSDRSCKGVFYVLKVVAASAPS